MTKQDVERLTVQIARLERRVWVLAAVAFLALLGAVGLMFPSGTVADLIDAGKAP